MQLFFVQKRKGEKKNLFFCFCIVMLLKKCLKNCIALGKTFKYILVVTYKVYKMPQLSRPTKGRGQSHIFLQFLLLRPDHPPVRPQQIKKRLFLAMQKSQSCLVVAQNLVKNHKIVGQPPVWLKKIGKVWLKKRFKKQTKKLPSSWLDPG